MRKNLLFLLLSGFAFQLSAVINQIRWGSSNTPLTGLTITWSNTGAADSIDWGYTTAYEKASALGIKRAGYTTASYFKFVFPGTVNASSTIYYKLYDSSTKTWTPQKTYVTANAENSTKFSFSTIGDSRNNTAMFTTVSNLLTSKKPDLVLYSGDITDLGNSASEYTAWFNAGTNFLENNVVYHSLGNHDASNTSWFTNMFEFPAASGTSLYNSVKYGNAIFICLNSESVTTAQTTWLKNTLAAAAVDPTIIWKVISFHRPFFNIGAHAGNMDSHRGTWWKAFDDYGVDLILNGHDHNYQRTKPVNLKVSSNTPVSKYGSGVGEGRCQIISGGAGAGLYSLGSSADSWAVNSKYKDYNFVNCVVDNCKMVITAYKNDGSVLETFTLDKSASSICTTGLVGNDLSEKFNPISVFPNPTANTFTLNYSSELIGEGIIKIYDFGGKEVASEKINKSKTEFEYKHDMSKFAKGVYNISLIIGEQRDNVLLIKE